jgi:hypothetical protein
MIRDSMTSLKRALELSHRLLEAADRGDTHAVACLDAERLLLLKSLRTSGWVPDADERVLLKEVGLLNDKSIGHLEHHRRIKGRQLDVAVVGRRAVNAYGSIRQLR